MQILQFSSKERPVHQTQGHRHDVTPPVSVTERERERGNTKDRERGRERERSRER